MRRLLYAFQFLTIIPLKVKDEISDKEIAQSAVFFPVVGTFQGLLSSVSALLLLNVFSTEVTAGLVILILILNNGGFHLDGLADTFDALALKSRGDAVKDRELRLSVMKDSTTGAAGVTTIAMAILLKYLFIKHIFCAYALFTACSILFLMPVFSKWTMIPAMYHGVSAREDGLGWTFIKNTTINTVFFASIFIFIMYGLVIELPFLKMNRMDSWILFALLFILLYSFGAISVKFFVRRFGGLTGDNLGTIGEISEILFLMIAAVWLNFKL